jgi:hypothetical protein
VPLVTVKRLGVLLVIALTLVYAAAALAANPRAEKERLTAADNALAKRAVVVSGWLAPGWTRTTPSPDSDEDFSCPGYNPDFSAFTITGKAKSAFKHPSGAELDSEVAVFRTRAQAVADFRLTMTPGLARCMRTALLEEIRKSGDAAGVDVSITSRMTTPPRMGERSSGFSLVIRMKPVNGPAGRSVTLYMDALVVQRGRSIGFLLFSGLSNRVTDQVPLARAMAARMR